MGEPLVNITFGTGVDGPPDRPGQFNAQTLPLRVPGANTSYFHTPLQNQQFYEGTYSLGYDIKFHNPYWRAFKGDHTGDPNGLMMIVNANPQPGIFYEQTVPNLCTGITYEFSAWVASIITDADGPSDEPVIEFRVENPNGTLLGNFTTPNVPRSFSSGLRLNWQRYAFLFVLPGGLSNVKLKMVNRRIGSAGNDLVIDDIQFRVCGPKFSIAAGTLNACQGTEVVLTSTIGAGYNTPVYLWQVSPDGQNWTTVTGANSKDYKIAAFPATKQYYRTFAAEPQNINSPSCRVVSNILEINAKSPPVTTINVAPRKVICEGEKVSLQSNNAVRYTWLSETSTIGTNPQIEVIPTQNTTYTLLTETDDGCKSQNKVEIQVKKKSSSTIEQTLCAGTNLVVNGKTYNEANPTGVEIVKNAAGCDSSINIKLTFRLKIEVNYKKTFCSGGSEMVNGKAYNEANPIGKEVFKTKTGCDSIVHVAFSFYSKTEVNYQKTLCAGSSEVINGKAYNKANPTGKEIFKTKTGCDSIVYVALEFTPIPKPVLIAKTICKGEKLIINGNVYDENRLSGNEILRSAMGCDSLVSIRLKTFKVIATPSNYHGFGISCQGKTDGSISISPSDGMGPYTISWSNGSTELNLQNLAAGNYAYLLTDQQGCQLKDTVRLTEPSSLKATVIGYRPLCYNQGTGGIVINELSGGSGKYAYSVNNASFISLTTPADSIKGLQFDKTYMLLIQDSNGCSITKMATVPNADSIKLAIEVPKLITNCEQIFLNAKTTGNIKTYQWISNQLLSCADCANPSLITSTTTDVSLTVIDKKGCKAQIATTINVKPARLIFAPDVFTPNGDNINDSFYLFGSCDVKRILSFVIYSRWGELVYFRENILPNDPSTGWNGYYLDNGVISGIFAWKATVEFTDESIATILRSVTVVK